MNEHEQKIKELDAKLSILRQARDDAADPAAKAKWSERIDKGLDERIELMKLRDAEPVSLTS